MQISNQPQQISSQTFQGRVSIPKKIKLPTIDVLKCVTNSNWEPTPSLLKTFSQLYSLKPQEAINITKTPGALDCYLAATNQMLKKNNSMLQEISNKLDPLSQKDKLAKIGEIADELGKEINVYI